QKLSTAFGGLLHEPSTCPASFLSPPQMEARLTPKEPLKIGWREWVGLPDLGVGAIKAKIDTGARTSALHAYQIEPFRRGGALWLRFKLQPIQRSEARKGQCEARALAESTRRNSGG